MKNVVTDTHALIWYLENSHRLSPSASYYFDQCDQGEIFIYIPTICLVEIIYLQEKGRIAVNLKSQLYTELLRGSSGFILADLTIQVADALTNIQRSIVPDMPDRIIAATALSLGLPLISRDHKISLTNLEIIW